MSNDEEETIMKKSIIKTLAVSLIAASFFSVTTSKKTEANDLGLCGSNRSYNKAMATAMYAKSLVGKTYYQMPESVKIEAHWCAAFTKFVNGITEKYCSYNSVTQTVNNYSDRFTTSKDYIPGVGDLIVYEEDGKPGNGYEHIGIVVNTVYINGKAYPETVEGNYFDINWNGDITKMSIYDYGEQANNIHWSNRKVGYIPYNRVRRQMVAGYIKADRTSVNYIYGDVNADGKVTPVDATLILRALLEMDYDGGVLKKSLVDNLSVAEFYYRMDANGDGKVTQTDATAILRWSNDR